MRACTDAGNVCDVQRTQMDPGVVGPAVDFNFANAGIAAMQQQPFQAGMQAQQQGGMGGRGDRPRHLQRRRGDSSGRGHGPRGFQPKRARQQ